MAKKRKGGFLAGPIPFLSKEPSIQRAYAGCTAWSFIDEVDRKRFVMLDKEGEYKEGDKNYGKYENTLMKVM